MVILFICALVLCCIGCNKQGVTNVHNMVHGEQSMAGVEACIVTGAHKAGWQIEKLHGGVFKATYLVKDNQNYDQEGAIANIHYSRDSYYVEYKSSVMMDYNETRNTIHKDYNKWVRQLDTAIQKELAEAELDARAARGVYQAGEYDSSVFGK